MLIELIWRIPLALAIASAGVWAMLALWFRGAQTRLGAAPLAAVAAAFTLTAIALLAVGAATIALGAAGGFATLFAALWRWWTTLEPCRDRDWAPEVARLPRAHIADDIVTLDNVRNFSWRTLDDFTPRWETRRYDLSLLRSTDLLVSYWMGPAIAHVLVSFGFAGDRFLVFSVEVRRTREQQFSPVADLFRESQLALIAADERDIVYTRSNVRGEDVYLYRVGMPVADMRSLFHAYVAQARQLQRRPRFYNTLYSNCTSIVYAMVKRIQPGLPRDVRVLLSGYLPGYVYDLGALDRSRDFAELRRRGHINPRTVAWQTQDRSRQRFSRAIRRGVPAPDGSLIEAE